MVDQELADLLVAGERAAFRGVPAQGLVPLQRAYSLAVRGDDGARRSHAAWLLGICHSALGEYGAALTELTAATGDPLLADGLRSLPSSAVAGVERHLGRHAQARAWDLAARDLAAGDGATADGPAECEAWIGLAADAIGLGEARPARAALARAQTLVECRPLWWRQRIRVEWARGELALLDGDPDRARAAAARALVATEVANAPRCVSRSLILAGTAATAQGQPAAAVDLLSRAAVLAEMLGVRPLVWRARGLRGALLESSDPTAAREDLAAARAAIGAIAAGLPPTLAEQWLARREVGELVG